MSDPYAGYSEARPPKKKRKVEGQTSRGLLGPGWEQYDATGLAQHYTHIKQVPYHLRKCKCPIQTFVHDPDFGAAQILRNENDIFLYIMKDASLTRRGGTVSLLNG